MATFILHTSLFKTLQMTGAKIASSSCELETPHAINGSSNLTFSKLEDRKMLAAVVENGGVVSVFATDQNDTIVISSSQAGQTQISVNANQSNAVFGQFLNSDINRVVVYAGVGDDFVYSTALVPTEVNGQNGNDFVYGGSGNDNLIGAAGDDFLAGQLGADAPASNGGIN